MQDAWTAGFLVSRERAWALFRSQLRARLIYLPSRLCFAAGSKKLTVSVTVVAFLYLFGTFFAQSRAQLGAAIARGMALRAFGTPSSMGLSKVFLRHIAPGQSELGRIKTSLRVRISRQGTPNGVMLLPPEACVFSSYMCVYFYCLKY